MNARLDLNDIKARLVAQLDASIKVSTSYTSDYLAKFGSTFPAVWVTAQRLTRTDDGSGWSSLNRQGARVEVAIRIVVQRYAAGVTDNAAALDALHNDVANALFGWVCPGADTAFVWQQSVDGAPSESVLTADLIFSAAVTYSRAAA